MGYASLIPWPPEKGWAKPRRCKIECVEVAGWGQATGLPFARPAAMCCIGGRVSCHCTGLPDGGSQTGRRETSTEVHDCFTLDGCAGHGSDRPKPSPVKGAQYWVDGQGAPRWASVRINSSGGLIARATPSAPPGIAMIGWSALQLLGKSGRRGLQSQNPPRPAADVQYRGPHLRHVCTRAAGGRKSSISLP